MKYLVYGRVLETTYPLANSLLSAPEDAPADVRFTVGADPEEPVPSRRRVWTSFESMEDGRPVFSIDRSDDGFVFTFTDAVTYFVAEDVIRAELLDPRLEHLLEIHLLGLLLSFWLEQQGTLALHGAAVVIDGEAVAFLATNKGGKTSLAASFIQGGCRLLTDDILALRLGAGRLLAAPGYPQMRMWPDQAEHFTGQVDTLPLVHPSYEKRRIDPRLLGGGGFCSHEVPVRAFFVPERSSAVEAARIEQIRGAEIFRILLANGFIAGIAEASGIRERRFANLSRLASHVPLYRLIYPEGVEHLPDVRQAILGGIFP